MATDSLVLQLQKECLDNRTPILDVLRKTLVVARKLGVSSLQKWVEQELKGYCHTDEIPEYRIVKGHLKAWNPLRGWIPTVFDDAELVRKLSERPIGQAIGELETLLQRLGANSSLIVPLEPEVERALMRAGSLPLQVSLHITTATAQGILDQVRTSVLNWCLDLEKAGILGDGMTFSVEEKRAASQVNYQVIFHGPVTGSQIQQGTSQSTQSITSTMDLTALQSFVSGVRKALDQLKLQPGPKQQLSADLKSVEAQLTAPEPKTSVIRECLRSARNILEGCAGSMVAHELLQSLAQLLRS